MTPRSGRKGGALKPLFASHTAHCIALLANVALGCAAATLNRRDKRNDARECAVSPLRFGDNIGLFSDTLQHLSLPYLNQGKRLQRDNHRAQQSRYNFGYVHYMHKLL